jgi:hypothetical protein
MNEPNPTLRAALETATSQAYETWAKQHPSVARFLDRITVLENIATRLRDSDEYRQAVAGYHEGKNELDLLQQLITLAGPLIGKLLG